jgi:hypothetical protein
MARYLLAGIYYSDLSEKALNLYKRLTGQDMDPEKDPNLDPVFSEIYEILGDAVMKNTENFELLHIVDVPTDLPFRYFLSQDEHSLAWTFGRFMPEKNTVIKLLNEPEKLMKYLTDLDVLWE